MPWEVEYTFRQALPVHEQVLEYPSIATSLCYSADGQLSGLKQVLQAASESTESQIIHESERSLALLFQILEMEYGLPIEVASIHTRQTDEDGKTIGKVRGSATLSVGIAIATRVRLPQDSTLSRADARAAALWHMFNAAKKTTSDSEAIRLIHAIWEYVQTIPGVDTDAPDAFELKCARDFVSHGIKLDKNPRVIAAIERHIRQPIQAFDPLNREHRAYVSSARRSAEQFIGKHLREQR